MNEAARSISASAAPKQNRTQNSERMRERSKSRRCAERPVLQNHASATICTASVAIHIGLRKFCNRAAAAARAGSINAEGGAVNNACAVRALTSASSAFGRPSTAAIKSTTRLRLTAARAAPGGSAENREFSGSGQKGYAVAAG